MKTLEEEMQELKDKNNKENSKNSKSNIGIKKLIMVICLVSLTGVPLLTKFMDFTKPSDIKLNTQSNNVNASKKNTIGKLHSFRAQVDELTSDGNKLKHKVVKGAGDKAIAYIKTSKTERLNFTYDTGFKEGGLVLKLIKDNGEMVKTIYNSFGRSSEVIDLYGGGNYILIVQCSNATYNLDIDFKDHPGIGISKTDYQVTDSVIN